MGDVRIEGEDPRAADVVALREAHLALMRATSPPGHVHALDLDGLARPDITFLAARDDDVLLGVGALRELDVAHGEVKSMHVAEAARGRGIARALLDELIGLARRRGYEAVSLETGTMAVFAPARTLYERNGFRPCPPFGDYTVNPYSTCMRLEL